MNLARHPRNGRAAALALLALLAAAVWLGPISAYLGLVDDGAERIARQARLLQHYRALVDQPVAAKPVPQPSAEMMPALPEAQVVALLQERVKTAAAASHVELRSFQVLRRDTLPDAVRVGVRIAAAGDSAGLGRMLFAIESARPLLYPDNLQVRARPAPPGKPPQTLDFGFDVSVLTAKGS